MNRLDLQVYADLTQRVSAVLGTLRHLLDFEVISNRPDAVVNRLVAEVDELRATCASFADAVQEREMRSWPAGSRSTGRHEAPSRFASGPPPPTPIPDSLRMRRFDMQGREVST